MFHFSEVDKSSSELAILVSELDAFQSKLYPVESNHCLDLISISDGFLRCLVVRDHNGILAGCGAVLLQGESAGEIKRVYIRPEYRGKKLGEHIVAYLEEFALQLKCNVLRLETGIHQKPAIALYLKCGYKHCEPFPPYIKDPLCVFMCKIIKLIN